MNAKLLGFNHIKDLYFSDSNFCNVYEACEKVAFGKFYRHKRYLFRENKLCIPQCSLYELLVREAHWGGLIRHFGVKKTLDVLSEYSFWPHLKRDVKHICARCIKRK